MKRRKLMKLSDHFDSCEFQCKCGCKTFIHDVRLVSVLEVLREYISEQEGRPTALIIHSSIRCVRHNIRIGGVPSSRHLPRYHIKQQGAADFHARGVSVRKLKKYCRRLWKQKKILTGGLGLYKSWGVHIDGSRYRRWKG